MGGYYYSCSCEACAKAREDIEEDFRIFGMSFARRDENGHVKRIDPKDVYLPGRFADDTGNGATEVKHQYWLAADCPNCGEKDSHEAWKGARMSSTAWGHGYSCCSDACGFAFAKSKKRIQKDLDAAKERAACANDEVKLLEWHLRCFQSDAKGKQ